jgi:hypothetical protein
MSLSGSRHDHTEQLTPNGEHFIDHDPLQAIVRRTKLRKELWFILDTAKFDVNSRSIRKLLIEGPAVPNASA